MCPFILTSADFRVGHPINAPRVWWQRGPPHMNDVELHRFHIASGALALGLPTVSGCKIGGALFWQRTQVGTVNVGIAFAFLTMFSRLKPGSGAFFGVAGCHVARLPNNLWFYVLLYGGPHRNDVHRACHLTIAPFSLYVRCYTQRDQ